MAASTEDKLIDKVRALPPEQQTQVLKLVERLEAETTNACSLEASTTRPIWDVISEISRTVPDEEWAKLPSDGSYNLDHYLYGAPKKQLPDKL